jgi:hypothetical protein
VKNQGNTVTVFSRERATVEQYNDALGKKGAHVVWVGGTVHGPDPKTGKNVAGSVKLADDRSVGMFTTDPAVPLKLVPDGSSTKIVDDPVSVGTVNASSVSLYGCGSIDLQNQYSNTNFTGLFSGLDGGTTIQGGDLAAFAEVGTLATGGTQQEAIQNSDQALWDDGYKVNESGDEVVNVPAK